MELLQLRYFKTVAEKGKITAAAESLYISPPALSATIARLEKELGVKLFERKNNSISLNRQGEIFLRYTNQVLTSLDSAKLELQESVRDSESHIRIATTNSNLWIGLLSAFSLEFPHITVSNTSLKLSQVPPAYLSPQFNFLLAEENDLDARHYRSTVVIERDKPVLVVNPQHPLAKEQSIDLRKIANETFILPAVNMSMYKMVKELLALAHVPVQNTYEYTYMLRRKMIAENRGVSFSTLYTSQSEEQTFRYIPIEIPSCEQRLRLFWDEDKILTQEENLFRDFAMAFYKN